MDLLFMFYPQTTVLSMETFELILLVIYQ